MTEQEIKQSAERFVEHHRETLRYRKREAMFNRLRKDPAFRKLAERHTWPWSRPKGGAV